MPVKKKTLKTSTATAQATAPSSLEEKSVKEEVKKPVMTQVVEVVEEESQQAPVTPSVLVPPAPPLSPPTEKKEVLEESVSENAPSFGALRTEGEEKKKEVVDELFQKSETPPTEVMPEISVHTKSSKNAVFLWGLGVIAACVAIGGVLMLVSKKKANFPSVVVIPTPTPTTTPKVTPTATASATRGAISIQVLNGGGVVGAATKMKKLLEDKGYKVDATGNADSYAYDTTEILVKASDSAYLTLLTGDLKDTYTLGTTAATLDPSVQFDARVVVGKK